MMPDTSISDIEARVLRALPMDIGGGRWLTPEQVGQRVGISRMATRNILGEAAVPLPGRGRLRATPGIRAYGARRARARALGGDVMSSSRQSDIDDQLEEAIARLRTKVRDAMAQADHLAKSIERIDRELSGMATPMTLPGQSSGVPLDVVALRPGRYRLRLKLTDGNNRTILGFGRHILEIATPLQGQQLLEGVEKARRELLHALPSEDDD